MTITLTPEIERALKARADKQGTTPEMLALYELSKICEEPVAPNPFEGKTLADVLVGMTGTVRSSENISARMLQEEKKLNEHRQFNVMDFHGVGHEFWKGVDVQEYINQMRDEWDT